MAKRNIKQGGGSDLRSPVYADLGSLKSRPAGIARPKPFRHEKQRTYSHKRSR